MHALLALFLVLSISKVFGDDTTLCPTNPCVRPKREVSSNLERSSSSFNSKRSGIFNGKTIHSYYSFPTFGSVYVDNGEVGTTIVEDQSGAFSTVTDGVDEITITYHHFADTFWNSAEMNGAWFSDALDTLPAFTSLTIVKNEYTGFDASRITFDANNIWVNAQGLPLAADGAQIVFKVNSLGTGGAHGDPLITGFHNGIRFWFNGWVGGIFNIYHDQYINVNSLFAQANEKNGTVMEAIAIEVGGHKVSFNIHNEHNSDMMIISLDGKNVTVSRHSVHHLEGCVEIGMKPKYLSIRTPLHDMKIKLGKPTSDGYITVHHLDFDVNPPKKNVHKVGGVIGQTASGKTDREEARFVTSELFGTENSPFFKRTAFDC